MSALSSHQIPRLGLLERLYLKIVPLRFVFQSLLSTLYHYPTYRHIWPLKRVIAVAYLRAGRNLTLNQRLYTSPPTGQAIRDWATANRISYRTESVLLGNDTYPSFHLHILSLSPTSSTGKRPLNLFYVHGGGFVHPINGQAHLPMVKRLAEEMGATTVYLPEYTLAPGRKYPTQHVQVVAGLRQVLMKVAPEELVVAGDSAGGNLVPSALAHIQTPSPYAAPLEFRGRLAGVILICPYARMHRDGPLPPSFQQNARHDYLTRAADLRFQLLYEPVYGEVYAEPALAAADFWKGLPVRRVLVVAGGYEIVRDDVLNFGAKLREAGARDVDVHVAVADYAIHVETAVDFGAKMESGDMLRVMSKWCREISVEGI